MLYSTVVGAAVMIPVSFLVAFFTPGWGLVITWPIAVIWAALAVKSYNEKLLVGDKSG